MFTRSAHIILVASLFVGISSTSCRSANIEFRGAPSTTVSDEFIFIEGEIEKGDYEKLTKAVKTALEWKDEFEPYDTENPIKVSLDSPGGDVDEAMKIGRYLRLMLGETYVFGTHVVLRGLSGWDYAIKASHDDLILKAVAIDSRSEDYNKYFTKCYSACVLIFTAGVYRLENDNSDSTSLDNKNQTGEFRSIPVIGLHRPYFASVTFAGMKSDEARAKFVKLERDVDQYLIEMGVAHEIIARIMKTASTDIDLVPEEEFDKYGSHSDPFYEEWLIAKCAKVEPSPEKKADWDAFFRGWSEANFQSLTSANHTIVHWESYLPEGMTKTQADTIRYEKGRYQTEIEACKFLARREVQRANILKVSTP